MSTSPGEAILEQFELKRVQAADQRWTFANRLTGESADDPEATYMDFSEWNAYGEIRSREKGGDRLVTLTAYFTVADDTGDPARPGRWLVLTIPREADVAVEVPDKGWFDIFIEDKTSKLTELLVEGPVTFNPATTDMRAVELP